MRIQHQQQQRSVRVVGGTQHNTKPNFCWHCCKIHDVRLVLCLPRKSASVLVCAAREKAAKEEKKNMKEKKKIKSWSWSSFLRLVVVERSCECASVRFRLHKGSKVSLSNTSTRECGDLSWINDIMSRGDFTVVVWWEWWWREHFCSVWQYEKQQQTSTMTMMSMMIPPRGELYYDFDDVFIALRCVWNILPLLDLLVSFRWTRAATEERYTRRRRSKSKHEENGSVWHWMRNF